MPEFDKDDLAALFYDDGALPESTMERIPIVYTAGPDPDLLCHECAPRFRDALTGFFHFLGDTAPLYCDCCYREIRPVA